LKAWAGEGKVTRRSVVLLVDDDPAMAEMYRMGLEAYGFQVRILPDAIDLSHAVAELKPDILVLDWDLPGVTGDEALEILRGTDKGRSLQVFMLSNFPGTRNGIIDRVFRAGATAWLEKVNTTPGELAAKLATALRVEEAPSSLEVERSGAVFPGGAMGAEPAT
jgi:DNA-binding response OmpR family regulator